MTDHDKPAAAAATRPKMIFERTYQAPAGELWQLWTTKGGFESWWGPEGFHAEVHTLEPYVGGMVHYDLITDAAEQIAVMKQMGRPASHEARGRFVEIRPHERLAITHAIDFLPGVKPYDNTMAVDFLPSGGSVRMVVVLDPMHADEFTRMSTLGFMSQLGKLDRRFGGPR